jgi:acetyl-CoA synthetase
MPRDGDDAPHEEELRSDRLLFGRRVDAGGRYAELRAQATADPERFWAGIARSELSWSRPFERVLDGSAPFFRWFGGGTLNAAHNCVDRHLGTPTAQRVAYYWEGEDGAHRTLSYAELGRAVQRLADALAARGFSKEDRAAVYLPMIPELPIAMLALAHRGIPFTVVFSGFSAEALALRVRDLGARILLTADVGYRRGQVVPLGEIADRAAQGAPSLDTVVRLHRSRERSRPLSDRTIDWDRFCAPPAPRVAPVELPSEHPLFLLYSSGTTGSPKGVVHSTGGYLTHVAATMRWIFAPGPTDVYWCAADIGWVTGHSYIVFGPLLVGATSVLYEGALDHPEPARFYEILERHGVTELYTSPTALRSLRRHGDTLPQRHDLRRLRLLGSVGEPINPSVWDWYFRVVGGGRCPVVDTWWQTETGGIMVAPTPALDGRSLKPGSATLPLPGVRVEVLTEAGREAASGERGFAIVRGPWPGMLLGLWKDDERYRATYWTRFPGTYYTGDYAVRDEDGYLWFLGRADEVLKVAGHRIGTALVHHPAVAEAAVCGLPDPVRGEHPIAFVVLRPGESDKRALPRELEELVEVEIGRFARPSRVVIVGQLPRTRSGKIMRRVVRAVALRGVEVGDLSTLEEEASVEEVRRAVAAFASELSATQR